MLGTWVPPPNQEGELLGTWFSGITLELRDDGTFDLENTFGGDSGRIGIASVRVSYG